MIERGGVAVCGGGGGVELAELSSDDGADTKPAALSLLL